jgi:transcriptional regulator with XRE-family HTH domain
MLRGLAGRINSVGFDNEGDLETKAEQFFIESKSRLKVSRSSREREYHLRVGNRVRGIRKSVGFSLEELAEKAEVNKELLESIETRPERLSNSSLINLRRIARALNVSAAELLKEQSGREQEFEDVTRASLTTLRKFAVAQDLAYKTLRQTQSTWTRGSAKTV